jgi:pentatricopeptide repeat protein
MYIYFLIINFKYTEQASRLTSTEANESKRVKKRILQNLGKLKKQLADVQSRLCAEPQAEGAVELVAKSIDTQYTTRKQKKLKRRIINNELADCAKRKTYKVAYKRFIYALNHGKYRIVYFMSSHLIYIPTSLMCLHYIGIVPDVHTLTNMINVCVRCGEIRKAVKFYNIMISSDICPNIVTYTTLLRGYADSGDFDGTVALLGIMQQNDVAVNDRTLNTVLRGFVHTGEVENIFKIFQCISDGTTDGQNVFTIFKSIIPTSSSYEMIVSSLCQALRIDDALNVLEFMVSQSQNSVAVCARGHTVDVEKNPRIYLALATAALFVKDIPRCEIWMQLCDKYLKINDNASLKSAMQVKFDHSLDFQEETTDTRSVELFLRHRNKETQLELESLQNYFVHVKSHGYTNDALIGLSNFYFFGYSNNTHASRKKKRMRGATFPVENTTKLISNFGLSYLADEEVIKQVSAKSDRVLSGLYIDIEQIFCPFPLDFEGSGQSRSVKLEIGSGNGDWVVSQVC